MWKKVLTSEKVAATRITFEDLVCRKADTQIIDAMLTQKSIVVQQVPGAAYYANFLRKQMSNLIDNSSKSLNDTPFHSVNTFGN